jgi:uncharacterized protein (DUF697 family)
MTLFDNFILYTSLISTTRTKKMGSKAISTLAAKREKVGVLVHSAATAAAAAASGMAQVPGSDNAVIAPIQVAMIIAIANVYDQELTESTALAILATESASITGRTVSQFLVGWVPGFGNAINASTAFAITEAVGWAADKVLKG